MNAGSAQKIADILISEQSIRAICGVPAHLWAIDTRSLEGHGLIGRLWFADGRQLPYDGPIALRTAFFSTRREARERLLLVRPSWPLARVIRVEVTTRCLS